MNRRPRDTTGRPLPYGAPGVEPVPDVPRSPADALTEAQRLFDAGLAFGAHEVLEGAWKAAPHEERDLWQGLAQLAVGITHAQRGNRTGSVALLRRASERLSAYAGTSPHGVRVDDLAGQAGAAADRLARGGDLTEVAQLSPRLSG